MVCSLKRSLYGLKQSPRQRYLRFDEFMINIGILKVNMTVVCTLKLYLLEMGSNFFFILKMCLLHVSKEKKYGDLRMS